MCGSATSSFDFERLRVLGLGCDRAYSCCHEASKYNENFTDVSYLVVTRHYLLLKINSGVENAAF